MLVAWAREQFAAQGIGVPADLVDLAAAVDQAITVPQQACGFEFHHDGSGRVDFQVLADSRQTIFGPALELPAWFGPLLRRCADTVSSAPSSPDPELAFSAEHCLAFDRTSTGLRLAGIWQHLITHPNGSPRDACAARWIDRLAAFLSGTSVDAGQLRQSASLRHYVDTLGIPDWIGLMSGRGPLVKIMATSKAPAGAYRRFFARPELSAAIEQHTESSVSRFCQALADADDELHSRIILDVDLEEDRFPNGFGIEVGPEIRSRSVLPDSVTNFLTGVIGIDRAAVERAGALVACLPARQRVTYALDGLEDLLAPELREDCYTARLSHLKVVVRPDRPPAVKTYVGLMFERGRH
jgi:hypothetical protein